VRQIAEMYELEDFQGLAQKWQKSLEMQPGQQVDEDLVVKFNVAKKRELAEIESFLSVFNDWHDDLLPQVAAKITELESEANSEVRPLNKQSTREAAKLEELDSKMLKPGKGGLLVAGERELTAAARKGRGATQDDPMQRQYSTVITRAG